MTVADSFDAMTDDRPYRAGLTVPPGAGRDRGNRGSQFSPRIVDALLRLHERGYLDGTRTDMIQRRHRTRTAGARRGQSPP